MATKPVPISELTIRHTIGFIEVTAITEDAWKFVHRELKPYCCSWDPYPPHRIFAYVLDNFNPDDVVRYIREAFEEQ